MRRPRVDDGLPFHGGWVVYLGYELVGQIEPSLRLPSTRGAAPVAFALRVPAAVIVDHVEQRTILLAEEGAEDWLDVLAADVEATLSDVPLPAPAPWRKTSRRGSSMAYIACTSTCGQATSSR